MFGMGIGEIVLILVVALLVVGPDKLPSAARSISKGLRDLRKQTREIQETLEEDTEIGSAIRDLKSALRGDDFHAPLPRKRPGPGAAPAPDLVSGQMNGQAGDQPGGQTGDAPAQEPGMDQGTSSGDMDDESPRPAPGFPEPVIRTPKAAVARGSGAPAPGDEPAAEAGSAGNDPPASTPALASANTPANDDTAGKKAHG